MAISIHAYGETLSRSRRDVLWLFLVIGVPVLLLQIPAGLLLAKAVVGGFIVYIICLACGYDPLKRRPRC